MSKGGAGKVYFVLYLAVVLELLIIIVERDEAEEHLHQKQKEAMKIVESILSQLQSGAGSEGVNTRPQDEITLKPEGMDDKAIKDAIGIEIKPNRKYVIDVGVTNIASELKKREGENNKEYEERVHKLIELSNVSDLEYQVYYNSNPEPNNCPLFPSDEDFKDKYSKLNAGQDVQAADGQNWKLMSIRKLAIDKPATFATIDMNNLSGNPLHPLYNKPTLEGTPTTPSGVSEDSVFYYSKEESMKVPGSIKNGLDKRSFVVNFQPPNQGGWYKLRFASRTNKIMGVKKEGNENKKIDDVEDETAINIGTVQLKAGELKKVVKEVENELEPFGIPKEEDLKNLKDFNAKIAAAVEKANKDPKALEVKSRIKLYGYIIKLLSPGQSVTFDQNQGSIQFNIRVLKPEVKTAKPDLKIAEDIYRLDIAAPKFFFSALNYTDKNTLSGAIYEKEPGGGKGNKLVSLSFTAVGSSAGKGNLETREFVAKAEGTLTAGNTSLGRSEYRECLVEITHSAGGANSNTKTANLTLFKSIVQDNITKFIMNSKDYGDNLAFNFTPPSGNKIPADQFVTIYMPLTIDNSQNDIKELKGLSEPKDAPIPFDCNLKSFKLNCFWIDPIDKERYTILPPKTFEVDLPRPKIKKDVDPKIEGSDETFKVLIKDLEVTIPNTGCNDLQPEIRATIENTKVSRVSSVTPKARVNGNKITIDFQTKGTPNDDNIVSGSVEFELKVYSVNPKSGIESSKTSKKFLVKLYRKID
jgi:hypothetical protein